MAAEKTERALGTAEGCCTERLAHARPYATASVQAYSIGVSKLACSRLPSYSAILRCTASIAFCTLSKPARPSGAAACRAQTPQAQLGKHKLLHAAKLDSGTQRSDLTATTAV